MATQLYTSLNTMLQCTVLDITDLFMNMCMKLNLCSVGR